MNDSANFAKINFDRNFLQQNMVYISVETTLFTQCRDLEVENLKCHPYRYVIANYYGIVPLASPTIC